ncbi:SRPBCC family protein [Luedemannella flava]
MRRAEAAVSIDVPIEVVWAVLTDLATYPSWDPFIAAAEGGVAVGDPMVLRVRLASGRRVTLRAKVGRSVPPTQIGSARTAILEYDLVGPLAAMNAVRSRRRHTLRQAADGATAYRVEEWFRGAAALGVPVGRVQAAFRAQAQALKERAEGLRHAAQPAPEPVPTA